MTREREEAIKLLTQYIDYDAETPDYYEMEKACKVAIKVLKQEPCEGCDYKEWLKGEVEPKTEWIPVSERLPEPFSFVNCTCHSLIDDRDDWVVETIYLPQPLSSPYSDWGNIPMLNWGECEVIAWMYRDIPEPYKAESEDKE